MGRVRQKNLHHSVLPLGSQGLGTCGASWSPSLGPEHEVSPLHHSLFLMGPHCPCPILSGQVINNYLDTIEPVSSEARRSRMHFHDNQRKVDYVLAYHYRKRGVHPGQGSPGQSLAIVSNGETGKEPHPGGHGDIELGPLDALEEEKKEQREEFEHNLMEAGLELEKDLEVRLGRGQSAVRWDGLAGLASW